MKQLRILILSSDTAGGHRSPAEALLQAASHYPPCADHEISILDILARFAYPFAKSMLKVYPWVVNHAPWIWGGAFHLLNSNRGYNIVRKLGATQLKPEFIDFMRNYDPDVIVTVYPHLGEVVKNTLTILKKRIPFITIVTDLITMHASWFHPAVDHYIVPTQAARINAMRYGVPDSKIHVLGLPVRQHFTPVSPDNCRCIKESLDLSPEIPVILVTGGDTGSGILKVVKAFTRQKEQEFQLLVVCGRNKQLFKRLGKIKNIPGLRIFGFVNDMAKLYTASDIIVTKAGVSNVMEAVRTNVPVILTGYIPGQEKGNIDFVLENKIGIYVKNPDNIFLVIGNLLKHPALIHEMKKQAEQIENQDAPLKILDFINQARADFYTNRSPVPGRKAAKIQTRTTPFYQHKKRWKLLLISSTPYMNNGRLIKRRRLWFPALNLPLLAGMAPANWDVEIIYEMIEHIPWNTDADLIGINGMGLGLQRSMDIADTMREKGKKVILGGVMASLAPEKTEGHTDSIMLGEADGILGHILKDFEAGKMKPVYQVSEPHDLCHTSIPRYDLLKKKKTGWWLPAQAGRGCPHFCEFCSVSSIYKGTYRSRVISEVIRDVKVIKSLGFRKVFFVDDNICADPDYAIELFREIAKEGIQWVSQCSLNVIKTPELLRTMAKSGCMALSFGLESINQKSLDSINKKFLPADYYMKAINEIRSYGIEVSVEMMMGIDGDSIEMFKQTFDFLMQNRIVLPRIFILTPIPGTPLFDKLNKEGRIFEHDLLRYSGTRAIFKPEGMNPDQLNKRYWELNDKLFTMPNVLHRIMGSGIKHDLTNRIFFFVSNLSYKKSIRHRLCPGIV